MLSWARIWSVHLSEWSLTKFLSHTLSYQWYSIKKNSFPFPDLRNLTHIWYLQHFTTTILSFTTFTIKNLQPTNGTVFSFYILGHPRKRICHQLVSLILIFCSFSCCVRFLICRCKIFIWHLSIWVLNIFPSWHFSFYSNTLYSSSSFVPSHHFHLHYYNL